MCLVTHPPEKVYKGNNREPWTYIQIAMATFYCCHLDCIYFTVYILADSMFFFNFLFQGGVKSTVSWVFEDFKFEISEGYDQFGSEPSKILSLRTSATPETVAFTPP